MNEPVITDLDAANRQPSNQPTLQPDRVFTHRGIQVEERQLAYSDGKLTKYTLMWCLHPFNKLVVHNVRNYLVHTDFYNPAHLQRARELVQAEFDKHYEQLFTMGQPLAQAGEGVRCGDVLSKKVEEICHQLGIPPKVFVSPKEEALPKYKLLREPGTYQCVIQIITGQDIHAIPVQTNMAGAALLATLIHDANLGCKTEQYGKPPLAAVYKHFQEGVLLLGAVAQKNVKEAFLAELESQLSDEPIIVEKPSENN